MTAGLKISIDVGGTNTDAAILNGNMVVGCCKAATTADVTTGVCKSVTRVLAQSQISPADILVVMVGTTHFLNARVQRRGVSCTAALRLCGSTGGALPPMIDWPQTGVKSSTMDMSIFRSAGGMSWHPVTRSF